MTTLEEEVLLPLQRQLSAQSTTNGHDRSSRPARRFWFYFAIISMSFLSSLGVTSLVLFKNHMGELWRQALSDFDWLVFAEGDQVAIDEVGRYLKKIDGVSEVTFVSSEQTYDNLKNDPALSSELALLPSNPFPACWKVHWKAEEFRSSKIQEALDDVRLFPGVSDVASDPKALLKVHLFRTAWYRLKLTLASVALAAIVFLFIAFGKLLFFTPADQIKWKSLFAALIVGVLSASAGAALMFGLW